jgi:hypothetical protein
VHCPCIEICVDNVRTNAYTIPNLITRSGNCWRRQETENSYQVGDFGNMMLAQ